MLDRSDGSEYIVVERSKRGFGNILAIGWMSGDSGGGEGRH